MELSRPGDAQIVAASRPRAGQDVSAAPKLQQLKAMSHDSQSIITFTAELDLLDKNRRGKSVASRLASFLQTIEQFTPIIDTYIQSNPDIAALIWGSIKLTFLVRDASASLTPVAHLVTTTLSRPQALYWPSAFGSSSPTSHLTSRRLLSFCTDSVHFARDSPSTRSFSMNPRVSKVQSASFTLRWLLAASRSSWRFDDPVSVAK
ncbi:hypothetical protein NW765_013426 [Fusarium oxysporum]|nr:hypothetical protein NW765_013426 [Fusarium oxysporum]